MQAAPGEARMVFDIDGAGGEALRAGSTNWRNVSRPRRMPSGFGASRRAAAGSDFQAIAFVFTGFLNWLAAVVTVQDESGWEPSSTSARLAACRFQAIAAS